ncbi:MAG: hypothetical protein RL338_144 [Chloroflexota bacterium]
MRRALTVIASAALLAALVPAGVVDAGKPVSATTSAGALTPENLGRDWTGKLTCRATLTVAYTAGGGVKLVELYLYETSAPTSLIQAPVARASQSTFSVWYTAPAGQSTIVTVKTDLATRREAVSSLVTIGTLTADNTSAPGACLQAISYP